MQMEKIISPCISICKTDPSTGYCYGCARTFEEKAIWKEENTTNEWKINNISELKNRLSGWQLSSFEEMNVDTQFFAIARCARHQMLNLVLIQK